MTLRQYQHDGLLGTDVRWAAGSCYTGRSFSGGEGTMTCAMHFMHSVPHQLGDEQQRADLRVRIALKGIQDCAVHQLTMQIAPARRSHLPVAEDHARLRIPRNH